MIEADENNFPYKSKDVYYLYISNTGEVKQINKDIYRTDAYIFAKAEECQLIGIIHNNDNYDV